MTTTELLESSLAFCEFLVDQTKLVVLHQNLKTQLGLDAFTDSIWIEIDGGL
jgi:hypothetical protein